MIKPMKFKSQNNSNMIGVKTEKKNEQIATTRCIDAVVFNKSINRKKTTTMRFICLGIIKFTKGDLAK